MNEVVLQLTHNEAFALEDFLEAVYGETDGVTVGEEQTKELLQVLEKITQLLDDLDEE